MSSGEEKSKVTRKQLIAGLNDDLSREYQAIISIIPRSSREPRI